MAVVRAVALAVGVVLVWGISASRVPLQVKYPVVGVVPGASVTQPFGCTTLELEPAAYWCPFHHFHSGIDLAAPEGTSVYSATSGLASRGFDPTGAGNYVVIRVDGHTRILYCHLATIDVGAGDHVDPGQVIGSVGATGLATGPHLHLEVQVGGVPVDPEQWLGS